MVPQLIEKYVFLVQTFVEAGAVGLTLLDHVVVSDDSFFSFSDDRMYRNNAYLCQSCTSTKKTPKP